MLESPSKELRCITFAPQLALDHMNRNCIVRRNKGGHAFPTAVKHLGKLGGYSQPSIVLATGCRFYVIKCMDFAGAYGLMKEVIGTELMARIGLPVPDWTPVLLTDEFIHQNPGLWWYGETCVSGIWEKTPPHSGLHFGSRLTRSDRDSQTYSMIPVEWVPRVVNRDDFVGALILSLWMNNCDRLQCVFVTSDSGERFRAVFLDHGHIFGGPDGEGEVRADRLLCAHPELCRDAWNVEAVARWRRQVELIDDRSIDAAFAMVPPEWAGSGGLSFAREQLKARREKLALFIEQIDDAIVNCKSSGPTHFDCVHVMRS